MYLQTPISMKKYLLLSSIIWLGYSSPSFSQKTEKITQTTKQEVIQNIKKTPDILQDTLLYKNISTLSVEQVRSTMLRYINYVRSQHQLKPLKINSELNKVADDFCRHGNQNGNFNTDANGNFPTNVHFSKDGKWIYKRLKDAWVQFDLAPDKDWIVNGIGENIVGTNCNIKQAIDILMTSPWHRKWLISPILNDAWIGYYPWSKAIVQVFIKEKK